MPSPMEYLYINWDHLKGSIVIYNTGTVFNVDEQTINHKKSHKTTSQQNAKNKETYNFNLYKSIKINKKLPMCVNL